VPAEQAIVAYLDTVLTETAGTNLFEGPMPETPEDCIAVTQYDAQEAEDRIMAGSLVNQQAVWPCQIQVMARSASKNTAQARAIAAFDALDNLGPVTLSGVTYHSVECSEPFNLGQDVTHSWRWAFNATVRKGRG
jgi:hypothetical protein